MLGPFSNYRQTELNWLKRLPDSWDILRTKQVFRLRIEKAPENNQMELLSIYTHIGVKPRKELEQRGNKASTTDGYWIVKKGDIISNKLLAWMGAVGVSHYEGVTSPAYDILRPIRQCNTDYYHYLFRTPKYLQQFKIRSRGIMDMRLRLYFDQLGQIPVPVPPTDEQDSIVLFLNWKTAQINKFIRNKRRFIELLKEQKQNVINQAVTRGLDPNVKLKPSGVEWIGDIPEHWEATKLKRVVSFNPSKSETRANPANEEKVDFLPMENISVNGDIDCSEKRTLSEVWNGFTYFRRGDVVVAKITPCFENGKGAYLKGLESDFGFGTTELIVLRPLKGIDGAFLRFLTSTKQFLLLGEQYMNGAAGQQRIPSDFVKNYPIGLPPIDEQREILEHIQEKSAEIDQAISRAQREIELMREYHTRLISDVVTGQVDVRGIEVPEVAEDELLAVDEDTGEAEDVIDDEGDMDETD